MKVTLNLATRPFSDLGPAIRRLRIGMAVLAGLSLVFLIGLHLFDSQAAEARAREHSLDGDIARTDAQRKAAEVLMRQPANAQLLKQTEFLNERFDEKAFSWTLAMEAMETVLPAGVEVTSIEPQRSKDGHMNVQIRVLGPHDESVDLVRNLERSRRFIAPRIDNETAESGSNPNSHIQLPVSASNPFEFELFADYNPPSAEELVSLNTRARESASSKTRPPAATSPRKPRTRTHTALPTPNNRPPFAGPGQLPSRPGSGRVINGGAR